MRQLPFRPVIIVALASLAVGMTAPCIAQERSTDHLSRRQRLDHVRTWMYQIQDVNADGAVEALAGSRYDMLVIEPTNTVKGDEDWDSRGTVARLKAGRPGRLVLAYVDIGEAESYRTYWKKNWRPPARGKPGHPDFIVTADPDGWDENYPVAFWDARWQVIIIDGDDSVLARLLADGYDGIYMDWVEAYDDDIVRGAARRAGVAPAEAMVDFILRLRRKAQAADPEFLVVAQNAPYLLNEDSRYAQAVDAVAFEDTWFRGKSDVSWRSRKGGDIPNTNGDEWSTSRLIAQYHKYRELGIPVFTCDYCLKEANARAVYGASRKEGFVPLVTRVSLARNTTTPPPGIAR